MPATRDLDTRYRENFDHDPACAAGQVFYKGTIVGLNAAGLAGNYTAAYPRAIGIMYLRPRDVQGVNSNPEPTSLGDRIQVRRGCHRMPQNASITVANIGQVARGIDDNLVGLAGGIGPVGVIEAVDADGFVWVNFTHARAPAAGNGII